MALCVIKIKMADDELLLIEFDLNETKRQKRAHISEIQLNGGSIADKVDWARYHLEKQVDISNAFSRNEMVDCIGITKGKGFAGVTQIIGSQWAGQGPRKDPSICSWAPDWG